MCSQNEKKVIKNLTNLFTVNLEKRYLNLFCWADIKADVNIEIKDITILGESKQTTVFKPVVRNVRRLTDSKPVAQNLHFKPVVSLTDQVCLTKLAFHLLTVMPVKHETSVSLTERSSLLNTKLPFHLLSVQVC